jgi:asparaginyl-tRNA synthetase
MLLRRFASTCSARLLSPNIRQLLANDNPNDAIGVTITGFVKSLRRQKRVAFAAISDGSSPDGLQAVLEPEVAKACVSLTTQTLRMLN